MLYVPEHLLMREVVIPKRLICQERKEFDPISRGHALQLQECIELDLISMHALFCTENQETPELDYAKARMLLMSMLP